MHFYSSGKYYNYMKELDYASPLIVFKGSIRRLVKWAENIQTKKHVFEFMLSISLDYFILDVTRNQLSKIISLNTVKSPVSM